MKSVYQPKKRHRHSKFDPYIKTISCLLDSGMSIGKIAKLIEPNMDDIVDESALYTFIQSRGLRSKVTQGGTNLYFNSPVCMECKECMTIKNTNGADVKLCVPLKQIITRSCHTSPMECPKRERQAV